MGDVVDPDPGTKAPHASAELGELLHSDPHIDPEDAPFEDQAEQGGQREGHTPEWEDVNAHGGADVAASPEDSHGVVAVEGPERQEDTGKGEHHSGGFGGGS